MATSKKVVKTKPETLRQKRVRFTKMISLLILHAEALGFETALDAVKRAPDAVKRAPGAGTGLHPLGLAADVNLYRKGKYLRTTKAHLPLGLYWESLGGSWGGRFGAKADGSGGKDGNHYSLEHGGRR